MKKTPIEEFIRSAKNAQVEHFYEQIGIPVVEASADRKVYGGKLKEIHLAPQGHVELNYGV